MLSDRLAKILGWAGIFLFFGTAAADLLNLLEMRAAPHPMSMCALAIGSIALLRTIYRTDGGDRG